SLVTLCFFSGHRALRALLSFPTRRSSDLCRPASWVSRARRRRAARARHRRPPEWRLRERSPASCSRSQPRWSISPPSSAETASRSEEHTSELQSPDHLVCRLLLEKKKQKQ